MPQIKHIARFTTPVDVSKRSTEILQSTNKGETTPVRRSLPAKLRVHIDKLKKDHMLLADLISLVLEESSQPLTVTEITKLIEIKLEKKLDSNQVRVYLQELEKAGRVSNRIESTEERTIRANGVKVRALHAHLWWAPAGPVPQRTVTEAVPGIILLDTAGRKAGVKNKKNRAEDNLVTPESLSNTPVIDYLIDKIVNERTAAMREELDKTKEELEHLRKKLRSLVGDL